MADLKIQYWKIDRLVPYARNARTHDAAQIAEIAGSIRAFGFTNPILVGEAGDIIGGHGRLAAARQLGLETVPVIVLPGLSEAQRRQLVLADNRIALNAGWDVEMLNAEIQDLATAGVEIAGLGFSDSELAAALSGNTEHEREDDVPAQGDEAVSALGDVWQLDQHRLGCGDCTDEAVVKAVLAGAQPHLMVTDPPYGVEYDPTWREKAGIANKSEKMGAVLNDDIADWSAAWRLFPGAVAYVWHGALHATVVAASLERTGFQIRSQIIWTKDRFAISRGHYHWQHEPCWFAVEHSPCWYAARAAASWVGGRKQSTVWNIPAREDGGHGHGTQKPVECMRRPILNNSAAGDAVYEPFMGSGTTLIACELTGRHCRGIELEPLYVDTAVRRWQDISGKVATLAGDGRSFEEISRARVKQDEAA